MIYISGPISANTEEQKIKNINRFFEVEEKLIKQTRGEIANPARWEEDGRSWEWYMERDLDWIKEHRPVIYMMNGWKNSNGAIRELELAIKLGLRIMFENESVDNEFLLR